MRVAVIGGTGLVGALAVRELLASGHEVVAIARMAGAAGARVAAAGAQFVAADVTDTEALSTALDGCQAAITAFGSLRQSPQQTYHEVFVKGAQSVVAACRARRVRRLVHLSSLGAHPSSGSAFHRAKSAGEEVIRRSLLDATVLRPGALYGAGDDFVVPLAAMLRKLPVAPLPGRGRARMQPVAAGDVALGAVRALGRDDTVGQVIDLPGPDALTIAEVYDRVMDAAGVHRPKVPVPYALIEPLTYAVTSLPGIHFTFDQLGIVEEGLPGGQPAEGGAARLGIVLERFTPEVIRRAIFLRAEDAAAPGEPRSRAG